MEGCYSTKRDDLHIIKAICKISSNEDLTLLTSLIQKKVLPTLGASCWIWYWQVNTQSPLELIRVISSQNYYSQSNSLTTSNLELNDPKVIKSVSLFSSNKYFDTQDKTTLLTLLKKQSNYNVNEFFNTQYKAIVKEPDLIDFAVLGPEKFKHKDYQLMEIITPLILLQKRNIIRKKMVQHYKTLLNEFGEETSLVLLDQNYQVIDCTPSFKSIIAEDYQYFSKDIMDILDSKNFEIWSTNQQSLSNINTVCQSGRRTYEVCIKAIDYNHTTKQHFWLVRLNRLFNEENKGFRKLREAGLTIREIEICASICNGNSNSHIAGQLYITLNTVKTHIKHIFKKMNVSSRLELVIVLDCRERRMPDKTLKKELNKQISS